LGRRAVWWCTEGKDQDDLFVFEIDGLIHFVLWGRLVLIHGLIGAHRRKITLMLGQDGTLWRKLVLMLGLVGSFQRDRLRWLPPLGGWQTLQRLQKRALSGVRREGL
jgi:hypothetical protein